MSIADTIRKRLQNAGQRYYANDNISSHISETERGELKAEIEAAYDNLLRAMIIDVDHDHNTKGTAERVARMYVDEVFKGRYHDQPRLTDFPNDLHLDEIYTVGPITIRSACSHHMVPVIGQCWIGIKPGDSVIGLSKFNRLVDWLTSRPHIQEEMSIMIADKIEELVKPEGLGVVIRAQHYCMKWRGVKEPDSTMVNSIVRGSFRDDKSQKREFFDLIRSQGF